jgi:hypothetical protein
MEPGIGRKRLAALQLMKTRLPTEEFAGLTEAMIVNHMTDEQLEEFITFMATRPARVRPRR